MFMNLSKNDVKKYLIEILEIVIGTFIMACSIDFFLVPNQLSTGGFSGLSTIAYYFLHISVGTAMFILNVPLFCIAFFKIGKKFLIKSILGTILLSFFVNCLEGFWIATSDRFLACIYGGILTGIGSSIILKANASTGGSDLLSYVIRLISDKFRTSDLIIIIDTIIILISILFFRKIEIGLYSAIAIYLMGKMIDIIFEGVNFTKVLFIISDKYEQIAKEVGEIVQRGSTGIYAKGMHTNTEKMMLFCVGSRNEVINIKKIATQIDPKSFIVIANAREAWGKGFEK